MAMDKTGTLTKGDFSVQQVVGGDDVLSLCAACESYSSHPIAESIVAAAKQKKLPLPDVASMEEIPGHGLQCMVNGVIVRCGNQRLMDQSGVSTDQFRNIPEGTIVFVAKDTTAIGYLLISDTVKADSAAAIARLRDMDIATAMLTGDNAASAEAVAKQLNLTEVHARLLPDQKVNVLQQLRSRHGSVMFVGDGINDAPVLAGADVGAAMGSGADAAIEAADVVFMNSEMSAIPEAVRIARNTNRISWQNVYFALIIKFVVMIMGLFGFANMWIAVFADTGVSMLCLLNSVRILRMK